MKEKESDYLNKLFAASSDSSDTTEDDFPMLDVPNELSEKLYAIAESNQVVQTRSSSFFSKLPKATAVAATLMVAIVGFQFYQQQQTIKQLEQAQADLAMAMHYLGEANRIAQAQVVNSINTNMKKAAIERVLEAEDERTSSKQQKQEPTPQLESRIDL